MSTVASPVTDAPRTVGLWNVANVLTMVRLVLVPLFLFLLLHGDGHDPKWRAFAWAAFAIALFTDLLDGKLARQLELITDFGKLADPIADKTIVGAALLGLSALGDLPWWITVLILVREVGVTVTRLLVRRRRVIAADRGGKAKTLAQGVAIGMYVLVLTGPLATTRAWVMALAVTLTVLTGLDFARKLVLPTLGRSTGERSAEARQAGVEDSGASGAADAQTGDEGGAR